MKNLLLIHIVLFSLISAIRAEMVPSDHVLTDSELIDFLNPQYNPQLEQIQSDFKNGNEEKALEELSQYFKERFSERYFFNWKNFDSRFDFYNRNYSGRKEYHISQAHDHMDLYEPYTQWKMPFINKKGEEVVSYPYRHLTRQHKADDIALAFFYTDDIKYLNYIPEQARSINEAFDNGEVESIANGNGAYEVYRAGNRMFNWLFAHQVLLASAEYTPVQQLTMIKCFLHTAAQLYQTNQKYYRGNHQTRGMSALAMISFLFPEIKGSETWTRHSLKILEEHLRYEIFKDGFQFERSVHYHISDIKNYFLPYQLASINNIKLDPVWETSLYGLFDVLAKLAFPDRNAPVLQDDTDSPWAEFNDIGDPMALGAILFSRPEFNYFASSKVSSDDYWILNQEQMDQFKNLGKKKPETGSLSFRETGYFIMREGWEEEDLYMIISAGLSKEKPDHQHGDMLGLQIYANGKVLLPNYQVRYYLEDLIEFKNSWTKSVLLIDSIPQGLEWKANKGGSGFGKWQKLPEPEVISWYTSEELDFFTGSHNAYDDLMLKPYRSVFFIKDGVWIVKDRIVSREGKHKAQQVWQGHYDVETENVFIRSVFSDGGGLEIIQLNEPVNTIYKTSLRGKGRTVFEKEVEGNTGFVTLLHPYAGFDKRIDEDFFADKKLDSWIFSSGQNLPETIITDADQIIYKDDHYLLLGLSKLEIHGKSVINQAADSDLWVVINDTEINVRNCGINKMSVSDNKKKTELKPGNSIIVKINNSGK